MRKPRPAAPPTQGCSAATRWPRTPADEEREAWTGGGQCRQEVLPLCGWTRQLTRPVWRPHHPGVPFPGALPLPSPVLCTCPAGAGSLPFPTHPGSHGPETPTAGSQPETRLASVPAPRVGKSKSDSGGLAGTTNGTRTCPLPVRPVLSLPACPGPGQAVPCAGQHRVGGRKPGGLYSGERRPYSWRAVAARLGHVHARGRVPDLPPHVHTPSVEKA